LINIFHLFRVNSKNNQKGIALIAAVLIAMVLMGIILTMGAIFLPKLRSARTQLESYEALYTAESGMEWCIYLTVGNPIAGPDLPADRGLYFGTMQNELDATDCTSAPPTAPLTVIGVSGDTARAYQATR